MGIKNNLVWVGILTCILLCGCSSTLVVKEAANPGDPDGVPFYLSKPYLLITKYFVTLDGGKEELVYATEEIIYLPDRKKLYTANYEPAPFASADFNLKYSGQPGSVIGEISMKSVPPSPKELAAVAKEVFIGTSIPSVGLPQFVIDRAKQAKNVKFEIEIKELQYP